MYDTVLTPARLVGASARTLRYYDQIGLLAPKRQDGSVYRIYGPDEVNRLQDIMFYRKFGILLGDIRLLLEKSCADREAILKTQLEGLRGERARLRRVFAKRGKRSPWRIITYLSRRRFPCDTPSALRRFDF